jgi:hypothetical protein
MAVLKNTKFSSKSNKNFKSKSRKNRLMSKMSGGVPPNGNTNPHRRSHIVFESSGPTGKLHVVHRRSSLKSTTPKSISRGLPDMTGYITDTDAKLTNYTAEKIQSNLDKLKDEDPKIPRDTQSLYNVISRIYYIIHPDEYFEILNPKNTSTNMTNRMRENRDIRGKTKVNMQDPPPEEKIIKINSMDLKKFILDNDLIGLASDIAGKNIQGVLTEMVSYAILNDDISKVKINIIIGIIEIMTRNLDYFKKIINKFKLESAEKDIIQNAINSVCKELRHEERGSPKKLKALESYKTGIKSVTTSEGKKVDNPVITLKTMEETLTNIEEKLKDIEEKLKLRNEHNKVLHSQTFRNRLNRKPLENKLNAFLAKTGRLTMSRKNSQRLRQTSKRVKVLASTNL